MLPILEGKPDGGGINSLSLAEVSCVSAATPVSWVSAADVLEPAKAESAALLSETRSLLAAYSNSIWVVVLRRACRQTENKLPLKHALVCVKSPVLELIISWQLASPSNTWQLPLETKSRSSPLLLGNDFRGGNTNSMKHWFDNGFPRLSFQPAAHQYYINTILLTYGLSKWNVIKQRGIKQSVNLNSYNYTGVTSNISASSHIQTLLLTKFKSPEKSTSIKIYSEFQQFENNRKTHKGAKAQHNNF